ncbi:transposase [Gallibacterium anatis]|uniref:helix-turn-helix domain-containing protein n=1 Tax=Gallibacterium anatis TaxID=750 RepID=UPI0030078BB3
MTKYNQTFKQQVVDFYFQHEESLSLTCCTFTVSKRTLRRWIAQYQHSGINGLAVLHTKRTYTPEFKYHVIQTIQNRDMTADQACLQFGIANPANGGTRKKYEAKNRGVAFGLAAQKESQQ